MTAAALREGRANRAGRFPGREGRTMTTSHEIRTMKHALDQLTFATLEPQHFAFCLKDLYRDELTDVQDLIRDNTGRKLLDMQQPGHYHVVRTT